MGTAAKWEAEEAQQASCSAHLPIIPRLPSILLECRMLVSAIGSTSDQTTPRMLLQNNGVWLAKVHAYGCSSFIVALLADLVLKRPWAVLGEQAC